MSESGYWTQQRVDALVYQDHERNHIEPEPRCWYCQNERAEALTDSTMGEAHDLRADG